MERPLPEAPWYNNTLLSEQEWRDARAQVRRLRLPPHRDPYKNWDQLAAIDLILRRTDHSARILDAGAVIGSRVLPWLEMYGCTELVGINPKFDEPLQRGAIRYLHGDITQTPFEDNSFDVITCMSVIEHGVESAAYLSETARILKPNGYLITSVDYYCERVDTHGKRAYGVPIHIYNTPEILSLLELANQVGLVSTGQLQLHCQDKPISWRGLNYTFLIFTLQKTAWQSAYDASGT
jgi:SAM-dependent methyltransferase